MKQGVSKETILLRAKHGLFVHKYSYKHEKLRKKTRRMCKDGKLTMSMQDKQFFYYRLAEVKE